MVESNAPVRRRDVPPIRLPGLLLGIGLGGFVDGIFLHQVFQWHHMFSARVPVDEVQGLQMNTLGDGLFHTVTWLDVLTGLYVLYGRVTEARRAVWGSSVLWGWILCGWGWFNLVEGLVDHQILGLHHVRPGPHAFWWDMGFLSIGAVFIALGWWIARNGRPVRIDGEPAAS